MRRLEDRAGAGTLPEAPRPPTTLDQIRSVEEDIARIEAEMRAAGTSEEEIRASYADIALETDLEAIESEIARLRARED